jgi:hypothetical protein
LPRLITILPHRFCFVCCVHPPKRTISSYANGDPLVPPMVAPDARGACSLLSPRNVHLGRCSERQPISLLAFQLAVKTVQFSVLSSRAAFWCHLVSRAAFRCHSISGASYQRPSLSRQRVGSTGSNLASRAWRVASRCQSDEHFHRLFGLPRVVSTEADCKFLLGCVDSVANGLTLCTGSYGSW